MKEHVHVDTFYSESEMIFVRYKERVQTIMDYNRSVGK